MVWKSRNIVVDWNLLELKNLMPLMEVIYNQDYANTDLGYAWTSNHFS